MTLKGMFIRWFLAGVGFGCLAFAYSLLYTKTTSIAERMAPQYVPLTEEEVYERARIACIRPLGATSGCTFPTVTEAPSDGTAEGEYIRSELISTRNMIVALGFQIPKAEHRKEFTQREIAPRVDGLRTKLDWCLGVISAAISLYAVAVFWKWFSTNGRRSLSQGLEHLKRTPGNFRGLFASRKLRRTESEFLTIKNLHENGLISDEIFAKRKADLRSAIEENSLS